MFKLSKHIPVAAAAQCLGVLQTTLPNWQETGASLAARGRRAAIACSACSI
jgi:hypothetical protein